MQAFAKGWQCVCWCWWWWRRRRGDDRGRGVVAVIIKRETSTHVEGRVRVYSVGHPVRGGGGGDALGCGGVG